MTSQQKERDMSIVTPDSSPGNPDEMTRLLCAGARLDPGFGRQVIKTLLTNRDRFAAPAYGYDAVPVLAHALDARRTRWARTGAIAGLVALTIPFVLTGLLGVLAAILLCLWGAWTSIIVERVMSLHVLVKYLKSPNPDGSVFEGRYPATDSMSRMIAEEITAEQDTSSGVVYYGTYKPFVGAGGQIRQWSIAVLLEQVGALGDRVVVERDVDSGPAEYFSVDEVTEYVRKRLPAVLTTEAVGDQRIERLDVTSRWYRKAISDRRPQLQDETPDVPRRTSGPGLYDLAREYLCIRVGSWDDELVTFVFVSFDIKGKVFHTELHSHVLGPIKPTFRLVDQLPDTVDGETVARVAWHATKSVLRGLIAAPVMPVIALGSLLHLFGSGDDREPDDLTRYARPVRDHGAVVSIRELAVTRKYRHYFQEVDAEKYTTIVTRRLLDLLADFLTEKGLDTGEFRERQTTLLNYGIIHQGSGSVVNTGTQAMGPHSMATSSPAH